MQDEIGYTHPMGDIRTAQQLAEFVRDYKRGKPPVTKLRQPGNPFWDKISRLGALPRLRVVYTDIPTSKMTLKTEQDIATLFSEVMDDNVSNPRALSQGFWIINENGEKHCFAIGWEGSRSAMGVLFRHPCLQDFKEGQYVRGGMLDLDDLNSQETMEDRLARFYELELTDTVVPKYDTMRVVFEGKQVGLAKAGNFTMSGLAQFLTDAEKYSEMFGPKWINAVRVGDGFYDVALLKKLVKILSQIDTQCQLLVSATPVLTDRDSNPLYIVSKNTIAALAPIRIMNWEQMEDIRTHHVITSSVPEVATDSVRFDLTRLERQIRDAVKFLKDRVERTDLEIRFLLSDQKSIEQTLSAFVDVVKKMEMGSCPSLILDGDEQKLHDDFWAMIAGTKFSLENDVASAVLESTLQSQELLDRIHQWVKDGVSLLDESRKHIQQYRPIHIETQ